MFLMIVYNNITMSFIESDKLYTLKHVVMRRGHPPTLLL